MITNNFLNIFQKTKVFLIGDVMLDRYVFGKINRISPEAPVPIFLTNSSDEVLGGSGNVLNNLISLGVETWYLSLIGKDNEGLKIKNLLKKLNFKNHFLFTDPYKKTTVKTRYISNSQQIIRVDEENSKKIRKETENKLIKKFDSVIKNKHVLVISDYNKGMITKKLCTHFIMKAKSLNIPVIIDPKNKDLNVYKNATMITPNQLEAAAATQMDLIDNEVTEECGKVLIKKYNFGQVLITRGEKGLSLIKKKSFFHSPTATKEVYDVSGAGDTVLAVMAACIPNKINDKQSLSLANKAAGQVIAKIGTCPLSIKELLDDEIDSSKNKILDINSLCKRLTQDRNNGLKIGFTNGCFDILHYGHINYIEKSKQYCDKLIVAINSNRSVRFLKGKNRPFNDQLHRARVISSLGSCDYVIIFDQKTPLSIIKKIKPDIITKGGDYKNKKIVGEDEIKKWGGEVLTLKFIEGLSSSKFIDKFGI